MENDISLPTAAPLPSINQEYNSNVDSNCIDYTRYEKKNIFKA